LRPAHKETIVNTGQSRFWERGWPQWFTWLVAVLSLLAFNIVAAEIKLALDAQWFGRSAEQFRWTAVATYGLMFLLALWLSYYVKGQLLRPRTRLLRSEEPGRREHLILFLSHLDPGRAILDPTTVEEGEIRGFPKGFRPTKNLDQDLDGLARNKKGPGAIHWPWEMPLRSIRHHLPKPGLGDVRSLKTVTVICSEESVKQVHIFNEILALYAELDGIDMRYLEKRDDPVTANCEHPEWSHLPAFKTEHGGWDFESFDDLSRGLFWLLNMLKKSRGVSDREIMIDFTGGQKPTSIVAASATFNRGIKAQYVQTGKKHGVIAYDYLLSSRGTFDVD
jgi:hypothetical protein